ncbi:MAG: aspartate dehydrogenase [Lachnospiraceae bacterium]|nr:aspartate dehydrogenase [Lachnospiraceae bacterium]
MFGRKKNKQLFTYDKTGKVPVIRASICTGEKVAGFKELESGKFEDLMLIRNDGDLKEFLRLYDVKEEDIKREW